MKVFLRICDFCRQHDILFDSVVMGYLTEHLSNKRKRKDRKL